MLEFCTLGTGGTLPIPERALSSLYVRVNGRSLLIDCGEGTQVGIRRLGWGFRCLDGMLLTHYHGDHCTGIAGSSLITSSWLCSSISAIPEVKPKLPSIWNGGCASQRLS